MKRIGIFLALVLCVGMLTNTACASDFIPKLYLVDGVLFPEIMPRYEYTNNISASLSFSGNKATCGGTISPVDSDSVSMTVTLYKKSGTSWSYVDSWSGSSTGGSTASAGGSATVGSGTYKVTVSGNVGGKEFPTKSVTKTKIKRVAALTA